MVPTGMTSQVHVFDAREGGSFRISLTYDTPTGKGKTTAHSDTIHGRFVKLHKRFHGSPDYVRLVSSTDQVVSAVEEAVREGRRLAVTSGGYCLEGFVSELPHEPRKLVRAKQ